MAVRIQKAGTPFLLVSRAIIANLGAIALL